MLYYGSSKSEHSKNQLTPQKSNLTQQEVVCSIINIYQQTIDYLFFLNNQRINISLNEQSHKTIKSIFDFLTKNDLNVDFKNKIEKNLEINKYLKKFENEPLNVKLNHLNNSFFYIKGDGFKEKSTLYSIILGTLNSYIFYNKSMDICLSDNYVFSDDDLLSDNIIEKNKNNEIKKIKI